MKRNRNRNLPEELVNEILLRLPVKALLVCKCVCKKWCALIKSPSFVNQHFNHESNEARLLYRSHSQYMPKEKEHEFEMYEDDGSRSRVDYINHLSQLPTQDGARDLMGPVNGVFCVVSNCMAIGFLNPAIREFRILPPHPLHDPRRFRHSSYYPPRFCYVGFGLDPCSGDFKVVAFERSLSRSFAFVYSFSSDSWKEIGSAESLDLFAEIDVYSFSPRILNEVNYWLIMFTNRGVPSVVAFNTGTEKFQEISIPDALRNTNFLDLRITEYGKSMALMSCKQEECLDFWVMGSDGSWSKSFSIDPFQECIRSLCVWKKNMVFFESVWANLKMYDISTQNVTTLISKLIPGFVYDHYIYKESLVSIKGDRAVCDFND